MKIIKKHNMDTEITDTSKTKESWIKKRTTTVVSTLIHKHLKTCISLTQIHAYLRYTCEAFQKSISINALRWFL